MRQQFIGVTESRSNWVSIGNRGPQFLFDNSFPFISSFVVVVVFLWDPNEYERCTLAWILFLRCIEHCVKNLWQLYLFIRRCNAITMTMKLKFQCNIWFWVFPLMLLHRERSKQILNVCHETAMMTTSTTSSFMEWTACICVCVCIWRPSKRLIEAGQKVHRINFDCYSSSYLMTLRLTSFQWSHCMVHKDKHIKMELAF